MDRRMCHNCTGNMYPDGDGWKCSACGVRVNAEGRHYFPKPIMTNADEIRAMTDEELATFLETFGCCHYCSEHHRLGGARFYSDEKCDEHCQDHLLEWLQQPAEED